MFENLIRQTLVTPNFHCLRYKFTIPRICHITTYVTLVFTATDVHLQVVVYRDSIFGKIY